MTTTDNTAPPDTHTTADAAILCGITRQAFEYRANAVGVEPVWRQTGRTGSKLWAASDVERLQHFGTDQAATAGVAMMLRADEHAGAITAHASTRPGDIYIYGVRQYGTPDTTHLVFGSVDTLAASVHLFATRTHPYPSGGSVCLVWKHHTDSPAVSVVYVDPETGNTVEQQFMEHAGHGIIRKGPWLYRSEFCDQSRSAVVTGFAHADILTPEGER